ncbi:NAD(+) diphosphatase [Geothermobacter hydrogeniphilus]|uniref:NAD(+) diphosphatase n=1 Tax=Geothermobacter hydrogeniphilus TaxID=1969733 RepID=A0A2K2HDH7_9BACT|nr:NAD(+) diphosphatase [Geothermobacter hydrogeniphilus]PNU21347.1 NAD(+) diphosphatase [Geothermobacter hydrogeniphilus]
MFPDSYSSPLHLPFNRTRLAGCFNLLTPDVDPGGEGLLLALQGPNLVFAGPPEQPLLPATTSALPVGKGQDLFLGLWRGEPLRLRILSRELSLPPGMNGAGLTTGRPHLPLELLSLGGLGLQLNHWERNSRCCARCGGVLERLPGEWGKSCRGCGSTHFPHIHPCIIVIVQRPGEVLLTRKADWAPHRYSLVAGFVDVAECLEETVAREVREETGVEIADIRYIGSQAWPFPSQLMVGFRATYVSGEIRVEEKELEDARWFSLDALPDLPPRRSIARYLLDTCLGQ